MAVLCCGLLAACWAIREMKCYQWAFQSASFQVQREVLGQRMQKEKTTFRQGRSSSWSLAVRLLSHNTAMLMVSPSMPEQGGPLPAQHRRASPAVPQ